jgi:putative ABC transport system permease protein
VESLVRLRAHAGSWTLVALLAAATTLSVTVAGPAVTAIEDRALRQALAAAPYHHRDITITQQSRPELAALRRTRLPGAAEMRDEVEAAMPPVLRDAFSSGWGYQRTVVGPQEPPRSGLGASLVGDGVTAAPDGWAPVVALHHQTDLAAEITVVDGSPPATAPGSGVIEVMADQQVAATLGLRVGEHYLLRPGQLGIPPAPPPDGTGLPVRLSGVFIPRDRSAAVWEPVPELLTTTVMRVPAATPWPRAIRADLVTDQAAFDLLYDHGHQVDLRPQTVARFRIDEQRVDAAWAAEAGPALIGLTSDHRGRQMLTSLGGLLVEHRAQAAATHAVSAVVAAGIVGVLVGLLLLAARLLVARRRDELVLLRQRGGSATRVVGRLMAEAGWVVLPGAAAGWLTARVLLAGPTGGADLPDLATLLTIVGLI